MKQFLMTLLLVLAMVFGVMGTTDVSALDLGRNITIFDGMISSDSNEWWNTEDEDDEVEPGNWTGQDWDLEGFFLNGSYLTIVGGYDFWYGYKDMENGAIFFDVDGDIKYGPVNAGTGSAENEVFEVQNTFGYDFALVMDFSKTGNTYKVYALDENSILKTVHWEDNEGSNAWHVGDEVLNSAAAYTGSFDYYKNLSDSQVGGLSGGFHNAVVIDINFLFEHLNEFNEFYVHYTMECGNDNLMGHNYEPIPQNPIPEPSTVLLLGSGVLAVLAFGRKRMKK